MNTEKFNRCKRAVNEALMEMYGMGWDAVLSDRTRRQKFVRLRSFVYRAVTDRMFLFEREMEQCFSRDRCSVRHGLETLGDELKYSRSAKVEWTEFNQLVTQRFMYYTTKHVLTDGTEHSRTYDSKEKQMKDLENLMELPFRFISVCND